MWGHAPVHEQERKKIAWQEQPWCSIDRSVIRRFAENHRHVTRVPVTWEYPRRDCQSCDLVLLLATEGCTELSTRESHAAHQGHPSTKCRRLAGQLHARHRPCNDEDLRKPRASRATSRVARRPVSAARPGARCSVRARRGVTTGERSPWPVRYHPGCPISRGRGEPCPPRRGQPLLPEIAPVG